jgi:hypothetical protein
MDFDTRVAVTDPLLEELVSLREAADMKPKITPVHVLNDVSATMMKINCEVCPSNAAKRQCVYSNDSPTA